MDLHRYIPFEIFADIIINSKLTLISPSQWDDTYEGWFWKALAQMTNEQKAKFSKTNKLGSFIYDNIYALCWSKNCNSIPMWSVYSYNNKAIMLSTTKE